MATATRKTPTFTAIEAPVVIAAATQGTLRTLDLTTKVGAWLYTFIGRRVVTALTRAALVSVRPTNNNTTLTPNQMLDSISSTAVAIATTLNGGTSIGAASAIVTSAASLVVGDVVCISDSGGLRVEWARIFSISGTTITFERALRIAHNSGDDFTTQADVWKTWLPGGEIYEICCQNNSGYALAFRVDSVIDTGDTVTA